MYESVHAMLSRPLKQHMRPIYVRIRELVGIPETQVDMRLRSEVEYGIDTVLAQDALDVGRGCNIALFKCEVRSSIEDARVIQTGAVVQLVE